jgi:hypothetical protein
MQNDRRKGVQAIPDNLRQTLSAAQMQTLDEITRLGWQLKFVRRPLFQDPVPVVSNAGNNQIGMLDPDGRINIDTDLRIRADTPAAAVDDTPAPDWTEKRSGEPPIPPGVVKYLNDNQASSLRQIENFGWRLHFVRRPLFQDPVVVIINAEGDRFGTLEADGRIEIRNPFDLRKTTAGKQTGSAAGPTGRK